MTTRFNLLLLLGALLAVLAPYYWLLLDNQHTVLPAKPITIAQLRSLAAAIPGARPYPLAVERSALRRVPGNLLVAGSEMKRKQVAFMAFRLPVQGGRAVMIESGIDRAGAATMNTEGFDAEAQARVEAALDQAGMILVTHEHLDHLGALVSHGGTALAQAAWLNPAQLPPSPEVAKLAWPKASLPQPRITGTAPRAIAPGIVVIPAPGSHTPGSQMVFVQLADGRELLFTGDIASFSQNWQEQRGRSRLIETWFAPENRAEVFAWLQTIQSWHRQAPGLLIVPGHDYESLENPDNHFDAKFGFSPVVAAPVPTRIGAGINPQSVIRRGAERSGPIHATDGPAGRHGKAALDT